MTLKFTFSYRKLLSINNGNIIKTYINATIFITPNPDSPVYSYILYSKILFYDNYIVINIID